MRQELHDYRKRAMAEESADYFEVAGELGARAIHWQQKCELLQAEVERLRGSLAAIQSATLEGRVCDDVAWFDTITTLHDFCDLALQVRP